MMTAEPADECLRAPEGLASREAAEGEGKGGPTRLSALGSLIGVGGGGVKRQFLSILDHIRQRETRVANLRQTTPRAITEESCAVDGGGRRDERSPLRRRHWDAGASVHRSCGSIDDRFDAVVIGPCALHLLHKSLLQREATAMGLRSFGKLVVE